jgi:hypothetical protein
MKYNQYWAIPFLGVLLPGSTVLAQQDQYTWTDSTNRVALSLRFGLNITAKFTGIGGGLVPGSLPSGYYDNGYVVTTSPPNTSPNPNYTTYWGYDNTSQLVGSPGAYTGVSFTHSVATGIPSGISSGGDNPYPGFELSYDREFFVNEDWHDMRLGLEAAVNYTKISVNESSASGVNISQTSDTYQFPIAIPQPPPLTDAGGPGQESLQVPPTSAPLPPTSGSFFAQDQFDADFWGGRLGPYVELPLTQNIDLRLSGGLAVGLLNSSASWSETLTLNNVKTSASGSGNDFSALCGGYISLDADYQINQRWDVEANVQFQDLGTYSHNYDGREVQLDLSQSVFLEVGVSYSF